MCGCLLVDGKNATKKWKKRERFLHTLGRLREEQVWDWSNKHRDCINAELHEVQNHKFAGIIFIKENSMPLPLQGENHKHIRKKNTAGHPIILPLCNVEWENSFVAVMYYCQDGKISMLQDCPSLTSNKVCKDSRLTYSLLQCYGIPWRRQTSQGFK